MRTGLPRRQLSVRLIAQTEDDDAFRRVLTAFDHKTQIGFGAEIGMHRARNDRGRRSMQSITSRNAANIQTA